MFGKDEKLPRAVEDAVLDLASDFDLHKGDELEIVSGSGAVNAPIATVAVYVGHEPPSAFDQTWVLRAGIPLIPLVSENGQVSAELPINLRHLNAKTLGSADGAQSAAAAIMESLRLLPRQRRVFVSYVRKEARDAALQLFAELESRQFQVFVDTHGVRPGEVFQAALWQKLCDSDVMVMLDTASYFHRQWTREEYGKANLKKAAILRVGFPGHKRNEALSINDTVDLEAGDLQGDGRLASGALDRICDKIERLRSRSIAVRNADLLGSLRSAVAILGGTISQAGAMRRVEVTLPGGKQLFAYPATGVPTATLLHEVADHAENKPAAIIYDRLGMHRDWIRHLEWLGEHVPEVLWIQSVEAAWVLTEWEAKP